MINYGKKYIITKRKSDDKIKCIIRDEINGLGVSKKYDGKDLEIVKRYSYIVDLLNEGYSIHITMRRDNILLGRIVNENIESIKEYVNAEAYSINELVEKLNFKVESKRFMKNTKVYQLLRRRVG